ncbi:MULTISPECIES: bifunctional 2-methylcitrate synthase/citrate synthase [Corynebacterium]|uniref:bifunctional 2-methylcitrate synthase/citrate synthase n=1 Tax=Corynebacterium TaxID=1716 RepID=UPI00254BF552|nr:MULTISPECIES: bifunctional 2-methylcitrate synthase/citrate synthase [Corynebacterium]MDK8466306.1 bifunctional 2-methylcitrate synthase/citrate synthase [Corynebacterium sp. MSK130]MDK8504441.1 bifunctional 2-methylcitrate synthase/citrate synthase [Corynebacterium accolens]MDK8660700.1 bifunctional 2-methylcitrate synthase/citrate synthase [Corynebacterium accolens]MDK8686818.1 bifunctional 2-methylcitrate synthase/citrate synthase [Corynebacterium sp. MSK122]MDK8765276.1 bifunctional 2-m
MSDKKNETPEIRKGLYGVVVDETAVSKVVPETNSLTYRGYPVQELARYCSFEEVAYLLWNGKLPGQESLIRFSAREKALRHLDRHLIDLIMSMPQSCHPMDVLRTAISFIGAQDAEEYTRDSEHVRRTALELMAKIPTIIALDIRRRRGEGYIEPSRKKGFAENFLWMVFGDEEGSPAVNRADIEAFDKSLILYAEHSFNASTFSARVVTSTMSDTYSAIVAAIGALKGPLHGGANEAVMKNFLEVDDPAKAEEWTKNKLANKDLVMGFGHRVYKNGDSRVPTMEAAFKELAEQHDQTKWIEMYDIMAKTMEENTSIKIKPNLDFPAGPAYHILGFDIQFFTPIFVMARITGWTAHIVEQNENNSLIRPLSAYVGEDQRSVPPKSF